MLLVQRYKAGIFASGNAGNLTLSLASGDFATGATITAGASTIDAVKKAQTLPQIYKFLHVRAVTLQDHHLQN